MGSDSIIFHQKKLSPVFSIFTSIVEAIFDPISAGNNRIELRIVLSIRGIK
jgi:hypothetical protein